MIGREIPKYCLQAMNEKGVDKSQCIYTISNKYEFNINHGEITLLRTTIDNKVTLNAIKDNKAGTLNINKIDKESLDAAIDNVIDMSNSSIADEANDIAPYQPSEEFLKGDIEPDLERMYELAKNFCKKVGKDFPLIKFEESILEFNYTKQYFINSNDVDFTSNNGHYSIQAMFSAKDGEKTSSFNGTGCSFANLNNELIEVGTIENLMKESVEQLDMKQMEDKFVGDIIITPDCLGEFLFYYEYIFLGDSSMISGTSKLKDKLNELVADPKFTLRSTPVSSEIAEGYSVTRDGFKAEDCTIIENGVLKSFLLSLYGANKTGKERAKNHGDIMVVDPGDKSFEELIKNVEKGILLSRFSGGSPSANGDFSGVAKNSFLIENGEIKHAITETMISGNLLDIFNNIVGISKERVNFGGAILPWVQFKGITISGK